MASLVRSVNLVGPYPISVPHMPYHHTLAQYNICYIIPYLSASSQYRDIRRIVNTVAPYSSSV
eukprot:2166279-Rhodomonas_salina.1